MNASALGQLVCPKSGSSFRLVDARRDGEDVLSGRLVAGGGVTYAVTDGIPDFVASAVADEPTVKMFAEKWARHTYYREHTRDFYTNWWLQRYGFAAPRDAKTFLRGARHVLDAGTGSGRDAANFAEWCDGTIYAVDTAAEALRVAQRDLKDTGIAFVRADINALPFCDGFFDVINCDQVIHHTADPRAAFEHLRTKLRTGGHVCSYVYRKKAVIREFVDDLIRERLRALPPDEALRACEAITKLGRSLASLKATVDVEEDIPLLGIARGRTDVQRFMHWNVLKCFWNDEFDFHTNNIINYDWYAPEHCHRFEPDEFRAWFERGWEIEAFDVQEAGISCRARKT